MTCYSSYMKCLPSHMNILIYTQSHPTKIIIPKGFLKGWAINIWFKIWKYSLNTNFVFPKKKMLKRTTVSFWTFFSASEKQFSSFSSSLHFAYFIYLFCFISIYLLFLLLLLFLCVNLFTICMFFFNNILMIHKICCIYFYVAYTSMLHILSLICKVTL